MENCPRKRPKSRSSEGTGRLLLQESLGNVVKGPFLTKSEPMEREHKGGDPLPGYLLRDSPTHPTETSIEDFYSNFEVNQHDPRHPESLLSPLCRKGKKKEKHGDPTTQL